MFDSQLYYSYRAIISIAMTCYDLYPSLGMLTLGKPVETGSPGLLMTQRSARMTALCLHSPSSTLPLAISSARALSFNGRPLGYVAEGAGPTTRFPNLRKRQPRKLRGCEHRHTQMRPVRRKRLHAVAGGVRRVNAPACNDSAPGFLHQSVPRGLLHPHLQPCHVNMSANNNVLFFFFRGDKGKISCLFCAWKHIDRCILKPGLIIESY